MYDRIFILVSETSKLPKTLSQARNYSLIKVNTCTDPEEGHGVRISLLKNHKHIGFLSNTGSDPLKNHKATKPAFNVGL